MHIIYPFRKILLRLFIFLITASPMLGIAQVGIGVAAPEANAMLEVTSTTRGLLIPRLTSGQRTGALKTSLDAVAGAANRARIDGMLVYDITLHQLFYYDEAASAWVAVSSGAAFNPLSVASNIVPDASGTRTLGTATTAWRTLYIPSTTGPNDGIFNTSGNRLLAYSSSRSSMQLAAAGGGTATGLRNFTAMVDAGLALTTGADNILIGDRAGNFIADGSSNVLLGTNTGANLVSGFNNTLLGNNADVTAAGTFAGVAVGAGSRTNQNGVALGVGSLATGINGIVLGSNSSATALNSVAIGPNVTAAQANSIILGDNTPTVLNVGIGVATPASLLELAGFGTTAAQPASLRIVPKADNIDPAATAAGQLYVTQAGDLRYRNASAWLTLGAGGLSLPVLATDPTNATSFQITNTRAGVATTGIAGFITPNTGTTSAGVYGEVGGTAQGYGVTGYANNNVLGSAGVFGNTQSGANTTYGVKGSTNSLSANAAGVQGTNGGTGAGVEGVNSAGGPGGRFSSTTGPGLLVTTGFVGIGLATPRSTLDVLGSVQNAVSRISSPTTVTLDDNYYFIDFAAGSAGSILQLPAASPNLVGRTYQFSFTDATGTITLRPSTGGNLINGSNIDIIIDASTAPNTGGILRCVASGVWVGFGQNTAGGGGGANTDLGNLSNPTNINQNLAFAQAGASTRSLRVKKAPANTAGDNLILAAGDAGSGTPNGGGKLTLVGGSASLPNVGGNIELLPGTGSGIGGRVNIGTTTGGGASFLTVNPENINLSSGNLTVLDVMPILTMTGTNYTGLNVDLTGGNPGATNVYAALFNGGNVGIGTTTPADFLDVSSDVVTKIRIRSYNPGPDAGLNIIGFRGTQLAPLALASGNNLGGIDFYGGTNGAGAIGSGAFIRATATEAFTASANGTQLSFGTTANGTTATNTRMTIEHNGEIRTPSIHNNGGTGGVGSPALSSGSNYTVTPITGVSVNGGAYTAGATPELQSIVWIRVGNVVSVSGRLRLTNNANNVTINGGGNVARVDFSLPVTTTNAGAVTGVATTFSGALGLTKGVLYGSGALARLDMYNPTGSPVVYTSGDSIGFNFSYEVF